MADFSVFKVTNLPVTFVPDAMYLVPRGAGLLDVYVASSDGQSVRRVPTTDDIQALIDASGGSGSGSASGIIHNTATRYEALSTNLLKVHCLSSSNVFFGLAWSRTGTSLTIQHVGHGRAVGDRVIVKETNALYLNAIISSVTTDSFTVPCLDSGATVGLSGKYTVGFRYAHNSELAGSINAGALSMPANTDIQLHSMRIRIGSNFRTGAVYDVTIPTGAFNPAGQNTGRDDVYVPLTQVRNDVDTLTAVGNTIAMNQTGSYSTFRYAALGAVTSGLLFLMQF